MCFIISVFICKQYIVDLVFSDFEIYNWYLNYAISFVKLENFHADDRNARGQAQLLKHKKGFALFLSVSIPSAKASYIVKSKH